MLAAAVAALALAAPAAAQSVQAGIAAWQRGDYGQAVAEWRPLADRGDADAAFNLGHAYRLGRGVPQDMATAEHYYRQAAEAGHTEAQAMYGLLLFQDGRRQEAMPFVQRAAEHGDPRAQYVYGTALFNGDLVPRDWPRAYAYMSRAAGQGLPYARTQLAEMDRSLTDADKARGRAIAATLTGPTEVAAAAPPPAPPAPPRIATTQVPPSRPAPAHTAPAPAVHHETPPPAATPAPAPASTGRWRVQLGAYSSEANARRAWAGVHGRLAGLQPYYVRAGTLVRLQAGPLASRAAASQACAAARQACFPVAP
jgi:cell division septation protein DedD